MPRMDPPAPIVALGTFDPTDDGGVHALIRRFRDEDPAVLAQVAAASIDAARPAAGDARGLVVVPVPGHGAGVHRGPRLGLAVEIARALGGVAPDPPPLRRVVAVPSARSGLPRDPDAEVAGLVWDDDAVEPGAPVLLVDDVLASGATLAASVAAVRARSRTPREVLALVIAVADRTRGR